ncbi:hypothetical protein [uncultured Hymenobacter sp.]|uniref:hypothetical protein n=1 Tax=uncultured Hymenobacter sp. TaxID=170016 RepID=UPI0035CAC53B
MPVTAAAQSPPDPRPAVASWGVGLGAGNGLALHGTYFSRHWLALGRLRGKWWGPESGPRPTLFGDDINTRSRQNEVAVLVGYPLAVGQSIIYGAAGLAYLRGRQLGEYRYTLRESGLISTDGTHYYRYRDYRALGLPLEIGYLAPAFDKEQLRLGLTGQADFNPEQIVYCVLATLTFFPTR